MANEENNPQIVSDEDWKQQAQREKEKLDQTDKEVPKPANAAEAESQEQPRALPPASFMTLIESLVIQAMYALGKIQDPSGTQPPVNLDLAKHHIDTLQVIQDKTKNNLNEDETKTLSIRLHETRMQYVALAQQS